MEKFENQELAEFLEDTVHSLFDLNPNAVAVVAVNDDAGIAGTNYHNCGVEDKGRMMHHILEDIVMDIVLSNIEIIRNLLTEDENDEDGGDDDGDE